MTDAAGRPGTTPSPGVAPPGSSKPAILKDQTFTVDEGVLYRLCRTGAIWLNKLFFSSLALLVVWLALAAASDDVACADSVRIVEDSNGTLVDEGPKAHCSVFLTPTAKFLGAMAVLSFLLSIALGALGLVVGKEILETTRAEDEVGAQAQAPNSGNQRPPT